MPKRGDPWYEVCGHALPPARASSLPLLQPAELPPLLVGLECNMLLRERSCWTEYADALLPIGFFFSPAPSRLAAPYLPVDEQPDTHMLGLSRPPDLQLPPAEMRQRVVVA